MFGEWLNQGLHYLQMMTASTLLGLIVGLYVVGYGLKQMVEQRALLAKSALRLIEALAVGFGFMTGTFMVLIVFVILFPSASDWIVNTYLPKTLIWQTQFQTWLSSQINDSRTATGVGLIISKFQMGSMFMGAVLAKVCEALFRWLMNKPYHDEKCIHERMAELALLKRPRRA